MTATPGTIGLATRHAYTSYHGPGQHLEHAPFDTRARWSDAVTYLLRNHNEASIAAARELYARVQEPGDALPWDVVGRTGRIGRRQAVAAVTAAFAAVSNEHGPAEAAYTAFHSLGVPWAAASPVTQARWSYAVNAMFDECATPSDAAARELWAAQTGDRVSPWDVLDVDAMAEWGAAAKAAYAARDSKPDAPGLVGLRVSVRLITDHGIRVIEFDDAQAIMAPGSDRGSLIITGRTEGMTDV